MEGDVYVLEQKRHELLELRQKKLDGMIVRSHAKWLYEGEKNTKYFCNLEKRNFVQKAMCFIRKDIGDIINDSNAVTKEAKLFDENLYASRKEEIVKLDIRNHTKIQSLSQEQSKNLEGLITRQEVLSALKCMKNDKKDLVLMVTQLSSLSFFCFCW